MKEEGGGVLLLLADDFAEFLGRDFGGFGVDLFFEEDVGLVDGEFVDNLADVVAVLCDGACRLFKTVFVLFVVFVFIAVGGTAEDVFNVVDNLVLGGFDGLDFVEGVVEEFPFERGEVGVGPFFFDGFGSDVLVGVAGKDPTFEEGFGHGGVEVVEELFADLVDEEYLALLVVGFLYLSGDGFAEFVKVFDALSGEDLFEEFFVEFGGSDVGATADFETDVALEFLGFGIVDAEGLFNDGGGEGFGSVEDKAFFGFLADEKSGDFGVFDVGEFEGAESGDTAFFVGAVLGEFDGFAVDVAAFDNLFGGFELAEAFGDFFNLGVDILGGDFNGIELGVYLVPSDVDVGEEGGVEVEGEILAVGEVGGAGFFFVGEGRADDVEFFVIEVFVESFTEEVLDGVGDDG